jgi:predicted nuclease of predicted toxin-antitoxin system
MKFYLDEDLSPKIAQILRKNGIDTLSAHEAGMLEASDRKQLAFLRPSLLITRRD